MNRKFRKTRKVANGYKLGLRHGYDSGYDAGFNKGFDEARHRPDESSPDESSPFTGTSIIIPTYNKLSYLKECIESIVAHTGTPYEIVIVDSGSTDGTAQYVATLTGAVQVWQSESNLGFAGAVNQGLALARGETILILNNDVVVTERWLDQMLTCLHSDETYGIVGPVTNYISGEQCIETSYDNLSQMHQFARQYNQSNHELWQETRRLTGFCMLMRRELFDRLGYFDEGFEIGNCEDDDYNVRVRLLGLKLIIARDTFIHHYGSASMKELRTEFTRIFEKNQVYYGNKWGAVEVVVERAMQANEGEAGVNSADLYPTHVFVRDANNQLFWVEQGVRVAVQQQGESGERSEAVTLSQCDLAQLPLIGEMTFEAVLAKRDQLFNDQTLGYWREGVVLAIGGLLYQFNGQALRWIVTDHAYQVWFSSFPAPNHQMAGVEHFPQGRPIIAPIVMKAVNI